MLSKGLENSLTKEVQLRKYKGENQKAEDKNALFVGQRARYPIAEARKLRIPEAMTLHALIDSICRRSKLFIIDNLARHGTGNENSSY